MKRLNSIFFIIIAIVVCNSCTYNPIFPAKKTKQTEITGVVQFNDGLVPEKTFVWLEGLNLCDYTDEDGEFKLTLSPAESQGLDGGISGEFRIYFYHPNYLIESKKVILVDGKISKEQQEIDNDGNFRNEILLEKIFSYNVSITPIDDFDIYDAKTMYDSLRVIVSITTYNQPITVKTRIWNKPFGNTMVLRRSGLLFYSEEFEHVYTYLHIDSYYYKYQIAANQNIQWNEYILPYYEGNFYESSYSVIPYVYPIQDIPEDMLYCMGQRKIEIGPDYLELPLQKNDCVLFINGTLQ